MTDRNKRGHEPDWCRFADATGIDKEYEKIRTQNQAELERTQAGPKRAYPISHDEKDVDDLIAPSSTSEVRAGSWKPGHTDPEGQQGGTEGGRRRRNL